MRVLIWAALIALFSTGAWADRRVALVIGNSAYDAAPLKNPVNDAAAMERALRAIGFASVTRVENAGRGRMSGAINAFRAEAERADTALVFYAGHGMELAGRNYLIPSGASLRRPEDAETEAIPLSAVVNAASAARKLALVVVDACRDNPWSRARGSRGLARVEAGPGVLVAFSTAPGAVAQDGAGDLSPYTQALTERLAAKPGEDVRILFTNLGARTAALAGAPQAPYVEIGPMDAPHLALSGGAAPAPGAPTAPAASASATSEAEVDPRAGAFLGAWRLIRGTQTYGGCPIRLDIARDGAARIAVTPGVHIRSDPKNFFQNAAPVAASLDAEGRARFDRGSRRLSLTRDGDLLIADLAQSVDGAWRVTSCAYARFGG